YAYKVLDLLPYVGTFFSCLRAVWFGYKGNSKEAAISAMNAFQGSVCDAFLIAGLKEPLQISVIHKIADEVSDIIINKAFDVEQNIKRAIDAAEYLYKYKKYEDTWNIYSELAKTDNIKLDVLKRIANYYNNEYVKKDERLIFEIALKLYRYNDVRKNKNKAIELIIKDITQS
ncbi:20366_t:CDS:2, partial [Dentiscutata erythropus]